MHLYPLSWFGILSLVGFQQVLGAPVTSDENILVCDLEARAPGSGVGTSQQNLEKARLSMKGQGTIVFDFDCYLILCKGVSPILYMIHCTTLPTFAEKANS